MRDPNTVAAIVEVLRQVHGDDLARVMLNDGFSLAILIDALLLSPLKNRDAVKLITRALSSDDFIVTPDLGSVSHLKYFYDRPKSLHVVDIAVLTPARHYCQHGHPLATDAKRQLIEPETAPGEFSHMKSYGAWPPVLACAAVALRSGRARRPSNGLEPATMRGRSARPDGFPSLRAAPGARCRGDAVAVRSPASNAVGDARCDASALC